MSYCSRLYDFYPILPSSNTTGIRDIGVAGIALGLMYFLSAACTVWSIRRQQHRARTGQRIDGVALHAVFPIYLPIMWVAAVADTAVGVVIFLVKLDLHHRNSWLVSVFAGLVFGVQHSVLDGLAVLLLQYGCGHRATRRAAMGGALFGSYAFASITLFYHSDLLVVYFSWTLSLCLFYLILYLSPHKLLFRRPAIVFYAQFW